LQSAQGLVTGSGRKNGRNLPAKPFGMASALRTEARSSSPMHRDKCIGCQHPSSTFNMPASPTNDAFGEIERTEKSKIFFLARAKNADLASRTLAAQRLDTMNVKDYSKNVVAALKMCLSFGSG